MTELVLTPTRILDFTIERGAICRLASQWVASLFSPMATHHDYYGDMLVQDLRCEPELMTRMFW